VANRSGVAKNELLGRKVAVMKSYQFEKVAVKIYRGQIYLSIYGNTVVTEIDDLDVDMTISTEAENVLPCVIENAKVIRVVSMVAYLQCIKCNGKIDSDDDYYTCSRCGTAPCMEECESEMAAQLMIMSGDKRVTLEAFGVVLEEIAECVVNQPMQLLTSKPFTAIYNNDEII